MAIWISVSIWVTMACVDCASFAKLQSEADAGTKRRFDRAFHHILNNAAFEVPLIAIRIAGGLSILDGNHRIAAFCGLQKMGAEKFEKLGLQKPAQEQDVWIGTHSRGETPLD